MYFLCRIHDAIHEHMNNMQTLAKLMIFVYQSNHSSVCFCLRAFNFLYHFAFRDSWNLLRSASYFDE